MIPISLDNETLFWHGLAASFPLALSLTAAFAAVIWLVRGSAFWRRSILLLLTFATAGSIWSYWTKNFAENLVHNLPSLEVYAVVHEQFAFYSMMGLVVILVVLGAISVWLDRRITIERNPPDPTGIRVIFTLLILIVAFFCFSTARSGALLLSGGIGL